MGVLLRPGGVRGELDPRLADPGSCDAQNISRIFHEAEGNEAWVQGTSYHVSPTCNSSSLRHLVQNAPKLYQRESQCVALHLQGKETSVEVLSMTDGG